MSIWFEDFEVRMPERGLGNLGQASLLLEENMDGQDDMKPISKNKMFPYECRNRSLTYSAPIYATIARKFDNEPEAKVTLCLGEIPVMVRSKFCNLHGLSEEELMRRREDCFEFGGYFIINGNERLIRMLVQTKRNFPIAFQRPTFVSRGKLFS